jgi:transposase InsO family protein
LEKLSEFNYEIEYTPGPMNIVPDALSRRPDHNLAVIHESTTQIGQPLLDLIRTKTPEDHDFGPIFVRLQNLPQVDPHSTYLMENGLLYLREGERMCIPDEPLARTTLLQEAHDSALAGHPGSDKTYTRLASIAYWPNMRRHVEKYVKSCHTCRVSKIQTNKPNGLLQSLPVPSRPWSHIAMDLVVHLPKTKHQKDAIAVFVDRFSKAAHFVACHTSMSAQDLADLFFKNVVRYHGLPVSIVSDRDPRFCSQFWTQLFARLGTRLDMSTAYHQQTDGQAERTIQTLEQYLRVFVEKDHSNWDELLDQAEFTYNSNKSASTNYSPFEAMYGFQPLTPVSAALSIPVDKNTDDFLKDHTTRFKVIQDALLDAQRKMAVQYDRSRQDVSFKIGDLVYLDASDLKKPPGLAHKLLPRYRGPFKIIAKPSPLNYRLDLPPGSRSHDVFHVEKLLPAHERDQDLFPSSDVPVTDDSPVTDDLGDYYEDEYEVQKLLAHRFDSNGNLQYKIRWLGFTEQDDSWQTLEDVASATDAIRNYRQSLSGRALSKHDIVLKRMVDHAPDGSSLKSGNVMELVNSI